MQPDLLQLSQQGGASFELALSDGSMLQAETIVRRVPNNRIVVKGVWNAQAVYAKLFVGNSAKRHAKRDAEGIKKLIAANIQTPALLWQGQASGNAEVLIFAAIANSSNAELALQALAIGSEARIALFHSLISVLASHHRAGLIQTDLYFKNFLVQTEHIYTLDGDGIKTLPILFKQASKLQNLATFFSKLDALEDTYIEPLYEAYCKALGKVFSITDAVEVWVQTQKIRHQVAAAYANKKVFRTCTDVQVTHSFYTYTAISTDFLLAPTTNQYLDSFLNDGAHNIKNGRTCTVAQAEIAGQQLVIKRYNIKGVWHGFLRLLRASRAACSWQNAHYLTMTGIATPKPLALIEQRFGWLRRSAYYLSAYVDAPDAAQFFKSSQDEEVKKQVAHEIARLFYKMYLLNIAHGDCKASNIKIVQYQPVLIDLDAMTVKSWLFKRKHIRDLKRLMQNWADDTATSSMLKHAFIAIYNETDDFIFSQNILAQADIDV